MWEAREHGPVIKAAEKAAESGNYASAERLLRDAARLQEASLGPRHPDLANTLNNLGIVCEITGKPDDAEQYFRRAVSIARTSLATDHPFVATSQKNLRDFCEARGKVVESPAPEVQPPEPVVDLPEPVVDLPEPVVDLPEPVVDLPEPVAELPEPVVELPASAVEVPASAATATLDAEPEPEPEPEPTPATDPARQSAIDTDPEDPEATSKKFFYRVALGALGPIAMLMVILAAGLPRLGAPELAAPSRDVAVDAPLTAAPTQPIAPPQPAAPSKPVAGPPLSEPLVIRAGLCGELDAWSCDPADRPVPPGPLFFYTQIKSPSATTIQHRWYQGNHLRQSVDLRVEANQSAGYRTYSRYLMQIDSGGNWRVEVRSQDGVLLQEERFEVH
jgi:hypothetical protein